SSIAHDFNNLLTLIKGYADMAQMNIENDQKTNNYLQEISKSIKGAAKLIHRLLDMSRENKLYRKVINVNRIIKNLLEMLSYFIAENIRVETKLEEKLWKIKANPEKIEQILMNLIINSRDAMPEGGNLTINTKNILRSEISDSKQLDCPYDHLICISVQDQGTGIEKSELEKIFKPFYTTKEVGKGTGLGLSIVKNFISQHKGWIEVDSEINKGSNFRVYLPSI
ncbi:MAG: hypothetical protein GF317_07225, partial [Candidatus Lokiarchaeota archaeon]|nr:hypothetical protein [Candidatus Lokiarchaeota archaeon]MBD3199499.1 hypothetical protein [Candidatus Lokiarchaeota archaeon]